MAVPTSEKLTEFIGVPMPKALKQRVIAVARRQKPCAIKPTTLVREFIRQGVERLETATAK